MAFCNPQTPNRYFESGAIYTEARPKPETTRPAIKPVFETADDGDYLAVEVRDAYAVIPRFGLMIHEPTYGPGAIGYVFECRKYSPKLRYVRMNVVKAAVFQPDADKKLWELRKKGALALLKGEPLDS